MDQEETSDQTMTIDGPVEADLETSKKKRSGVFGIIAIFSSLILIPVALFGSFSETTETDAAVSNNITIRVVLSTKQFLTVTSGNVCDGVGDYKNIKKTTLNIKQGSWNTKSSIGKGNLNDQGSCVYEITLAPPSTFDGGTLKISIDFPFGSLPEDSYEVGDSVPYAITTISVPLD
jgi:hypothetical protein